MRNIASDILVAAVLAATLVAQEAADPRVELAQPIALEEQEGDLAKAEQSYRAALEGKDLSAAARVLACQRLGRLLQRLGRMDEAQRWLAQAAEAKGAVVSLDDVTAQAQDPEREQQLRLQARELLRRVSSTKRLVGASEELQGFGTEDAQQLLWIGRAAVPEVVAVLEELSRDRKPNSRSAVNGMFAFLWRVGGPQASAYLVEAARNPNVAELAADTASFAKNIDIDAPDVRAFLEHPDWQIAKSMLEHPARGGVADMLAPADLVTIAERGGASMRGFVLHKLTGNSYYPPQLLTRLHQLVRNGLGGTDPAYGQAAEAFLTCASSQQSTDGLVLLLRQLPALHGRGVPVADRTSLRSPPDNRGRGRAFTQLDAAQVPDVLTEIDASVAAIGDVAGNQSFATRWLTQLMLEVLEQLPGERGLQRALAWWDKGYEVAAAFRGRVTPQNAAELMRRFGRLLPPADPARFLDYFDGVELPRAMFASIRERAAATQDIGLRSRLLRMMAETGDERAADAALAEWRANADMGKWAAGCLLTLGRRNPAPPVLAAMDSMVRADGKPIADTVRSELLLALLSSGWRTRSLTLRYDRALDLVAAGMSTAPARHPYASRDDAPKLSPLQYLVYREVDPPHGFTPEQVVPHLRTLFANADSAPLFAPDRWSVPAIADVYLVELAERSPMFRTDWQQIAAARLNDQLAAGTSGGPMFDWFAQVLANPADKKVMPIPPAVARRFRDRLLQLVDSENPAWARAAASALRDIGEPLDLARLAGNHNADVRAWVADLVRDGEAEVPDSVMLKLLADPDVTVRYVTTEYFGATVNKAAVPGLITLLRAPESDLRKAAADALTKIRFYHEQQAHWDRVLKDMDASPASALEKLLLQAKPGAPKQQRLLAIASLGALRAPEALPFLIDWTQDGDGDVADRAKAAITAIHLDPRK